MHTCCVHFQNLLNLSVKVFQWLAFVKGVFLVTYVQSPGYANILPERNWPEQSESVGFHQSELASQKIGCAESEDNNSKKSTICEIKKMQIVCREDAVGIQGLSGPWLADSAHCSRLDQVFLFCRMHTVLQPPPSYLYAKWWQGGDVRNHIHHWPLNLVTLRLAIFIGFTQISPRARPTTGAHSDTTVPFYQGGQPWS